MQQGLRIETNKQLPKIDSELSHTQVLEISSTYDICHRPFMTLILVSNVSIRYHSTKQTFGK